MPTPCCAFWATIRLMLPDYQEIEYYDVLILGAGPAGATCALRLRDSGLKVLLLDKAVFPRDKICGDAVGGRSMKVLAGICPEAAEDIRALPEKTSSRRTRMDFGLKRSFEISWVLEAYCCRRVDFDNALLEGVKKYAPEIGIREGFLVNSLEKTDQAYVVGNKTSAQYFKTRMLVACDGSQSFVAKTLNGSKIRLKDHAAAVRAYYSNVKGMEAERTEIFMLPQFAPGYLWVFPITDKISNVGFGMLSDSISRKKVNLKTQLQAFIQASPELRERFAGSEQLGKLEGFGLALGSHRPRMSGDHFLLAGDAASLVDPLSGDGISNAIISGRVAADTVREAFAQQRFDAAFLQRYEKNLFRIIGAEMRRNTLIMRLLTNAPALVKIGAWVLGFRWAQWVVRRVL